ncbi:MAG TPA: lysophospholipid acyltransferase family protein [Candidatus Saccharimonadales bacterium]|nr:lysophospholipid acyltransferase family protein [Candidatus Saccharimonadales bacterium]
MPKRYEEIGVSEADRYFYALSHFVVRAVGLATVLFRTEGAENLPQDGRGLIVSNHLHWSDVLFVPSAVPKRHVVVAGRRKFMEAPVVGALFDRWGAVVIDRGQENPGREALLQSLQTIKKPLEEDRLELLFASPNTRTPGIKPGPTNGGVARAAYETATDVYAAVIKGSDRLSDQRVSVGFSSSLGYPDSDKPRERKEYLHHLWEVQTEMFDNIPHPFNYRAPDLE